MIWVVNTKDKIIYARPCWAELPGNPSAGPSLEQLFGLYAGELLGCRGIYRAGDAGESQRYGELTRTIYRVVIAGKLSPGPNPDKMSICREALGGPMSIPNKFPKPDPDY